MEIRINVKRSFGYLVFFLAFGLMSFFIVAAYGGGNPSTTGHSGGEVDVTYNSATVSLNNFVSDIDSRVDSAETDISSGGCVEYDATDLAGDDIAINVPRQCYYGGCQISASISDSVGGFKISWGLYTQFGDPDFPLINGERYTFMRIKDGTNPETDGISFEDGSSQKNGDGTSGLLFNFSMSSITLRDDSNGAGETSATQWTVRDQNGAYDWDYLRIC